MYISVFIINLMHSQIFHQLITAHFSRCNGWRIWISFRALSNSEGFHEESIQYDRAEENWDFRKSHRHRFILEFGYFLYIVEADFYIVAMAYAIKRFMLCLNSSMSAFEILAWRNRIAPRNWPYFDWKFHCDRHVTLLKILFRTKIMMMCVGVGWVLVTNLWSFQESRWV